MALDPKKRQQQLAKKKAKRKQTVTTKKKSAGLFGGAFSLARQMAAAQRAPIHECLAPGNLSGNGMGTVIVARKLADGEIAAGIFLVDAFCLGIKNAYFRVFEPDEYQELLSGVNQNENLENIHPSCARKLLEGAIDYAKDLGFKPHFDYHTAKAIFADIDAGACPVKYKYGRDGKPFYISGPYESQADIKRIVEQLRRRCGEGNYDFMMRIGGDDEDF